MTGMVGNLRGLSGNGENEDSLTMSEYTEGRRGIFTMVVNHRRKHPMVLRKI